MRTLLAAVLLAPSLALASGYSLPNTNPRDLAMCASAVAAQRDAGAAFALPAALSRLEGPSARVSVGGVNVFNRWKDPQTGSEVNMRTATTVIGGVSAGYGGKFSMGGSSQGWGAGLSLQPFGGAIVEWPSDWAGRYRVIDVDRKVYSGTLTAGVEVLPRVRIGGGLVYYYTTQEFRQAAWMAPFAPGSNPVNPATWNVNQPDAVATLDMDGGAPSFDVSAEIDPLPNLPLTVAVDYKHKASQHLSGDVSWEGLTATARALGGSGNAARAAAIFRDLGVEQTLTIPNVINVGVAYRPVKPVLLAATWTLDRWVVYDRDLFVAKDGSTSIDVPRDYDNGQTYRVGVEWDATRALQLRAGVQRDESGLDERVYSPSLPDSSSWGASLGAGFRFTRSVSADVAVFYARMDEVKVPADAAGLEPQRTLPAGPFVTSPTGTFRGEYQPEALVYGVNVSWTPGRPD